MAQPSVGTPIQLYSSATSGNIPVAANLAQGELAINTADGKLYYKTSGGSVAVLANAAVSTGNLPGGSTGTVVYQSATGVTAYLPLGSTNSLLYSNGTGPAYASIGTAGSIVYSTGTAPTSLALGAANTVLISNGSTPQYVSQSSLSVGTAATAGFATSAGSASTATTATTATNIVGGTSNQVVYQSGTGATSFVNAPTVTGTVLGWTGTNFAWVSAPAATTAANIAGGAQYQIPFQSAVSTTTFSANLTFNSSTNTFSTTNITATSALSGNTVAATASITAGTSISAGTTITATGGITGSTITANSSISTSATTGAFNYGTLSYSDVNILGSYVGNVNNYVQKVLQNTNSGSSASVDFIVSNNIGTASTYYGDFGMNSSTYSGVGSFQQPNVVYLYSVSSDLVVGTQGANYLRLVTNNNSADTMTLSPTNAVAFNGSYGTAGYILTSGGTSGAPTWVNPTTIGTSQGKLYFFGQFG